jgi:hypothetical protein
MFSTRLSGYVFVAFVLVSSPWALPMGQRGGAPSGHGRDARGIERPPTIGTDANGTDVALGGSNEPTVAVNPLNQHNVAMSSLFKYRVSQNGGVTWSAALSTIVPAGYGQEGDPSLAFDSQCPPFYGYQGFSSTGADVFVARLNPVTGAYISVPIRVSTPGDENDNSTLAADRHATSPFADRLYMVWTEFPTAGGTRVLTSFSSNQGATWSSPLPVSVAGEGFVWPAHVAVAPNGDVYVSYQSQTGFNEIGEAGGNPDGISGKIFVVRSTDGGVSFSQKSLAYTAGNADITFNVQSSPGAIPGTKFWLQGSGEGWVLPDAQIAGNVYVVAADDPDNNHASGDASNIYIVRSTDNGMTWSSPIRVDHDAGTSFQVMPTATIDDKTDQIAVMWYDNRLGGTNAGGSWLLNVFYTVSNDHGLTFGPDVKIDDTPFDPDLGAPTRFAGPPPTLRIGEYFGITMGCGDIQMVWCGNKAAGQQTITDSFVAPTALTPYCFGDGTLATACPCANTGGTAHGCQNSATTGGAVLAGCGTTSPDTIMLTSSGELPTVLTIFLQGNANLAAGTVFGDGLRCVNGSLKRLYAKNASGGYVTAPGPGDPSISARSAALGDPIAPGTMRYYQAYYRDPVLTFCASPPGDSWNVSSGITIAW